MAATSEAKDKIRIAEKHTNQVNGLTRSAVRLLKDGHEGTNAYGVFIDRYQRESELREARAAIDKALDLIGATNWPTTADWELF